ncbi:MAG: pilus assembly protein TadG-related protein [Bacillota bacterium]
MSLSRDRNSNNSNGQKLLRGSGKIFPPIRLERVSYGERGGVIALIVLFLPVAVLSIGIVADLGLVFTARRSVQAACDLGVLAGCQELDWELLAQGLVVIKPVEGETTAIEIARANLEGMKNILFDMHLRATVSNRFQDEPGITLEADFKVQTYFLRWLPGFKEGIEFHIVSESAVVERKKW